jgi:ubiquitin thioesterase protein OTUB1
MTESTDGSDQRPTDKEIQAHHDSIKVDYMTKPLIAPFNPSAFTDLEDEYIGNEKAVFAPKIQHLKTLFSGSRATRRDGNCFYRAVGFRFAELLKDDKTSEAWRKFALANMKNSLKMICSNGYVESIVEGLPST